MSASTAQTAKAADEKPAMAAQETEQKAQGQKDQEQDESEKNFNMKSPKFWLPMIGMYISFFLVALDRLIIATAIPSITDEFNSIEDIGWYGSAYMLTCAIFMLLFGRLYQIYSTKWTYVVSIVIFEVGSAVCGAAPSSIALILGRAIAGIGGAGIFNGGLLIIVTLVPLRKRPIFTSIFGMVFGISSVLGPLVGGSFTDNPHLTWRWCFYVNLPIGGFTIAAMLLFFHFESTNLKKMTLLDQLKRLDPLGLLFFIPSMVCLILALQWGGSTYAWSAPKVIGLLVCFAATFVIFIVIQFLTPETALVPKRIFWQRSVAGAALFLFLVNAALMITIYYLSIWFQAAQGQSAVQSGVRTIPTVLALIVFGFLAAFSTQKIGYYVPNMLISPILCAAGAGMLSTIKPDAGANQWIGYQVLFGAGLGLGQQSATLAPQAVLPRIDVPLGVGLLFFAQQLGGAIFLSVGQSLFSQDLVKRLDGTAGLDIEKILKTGATALRTVVPSNELDTVITAYSYSLTYTFKLGAALAACLIIGVLMLEWKNINEKKGSTPNQDAQIKAEEAREATEVGDGQESVETAAETAAKEKETLG